MAGGHSALGGTRLTMSVRLCRVEAIVIERETSVEIRIGIVNAPREIGFETTQSPADIEALVADALAGKTPYLKLSDEKGKIYIVPTATIGFVELGNDQSRRVGFVG